MTELLDRLRIATGASHKRLESSLDLLRPPLSRPRFEAILQRFYGFHAVWEPALSSLDRLKAVFQGRSKLDQLRTDLARLGASTDVALCDAASALCSDESRAIGSLYVIEGSTLGGQVISRALSTASWVPPQGLEYFNPYAAENGRRWREFKEWANAALPRESWDGAEAGARDTFDLLHDWITPGLPQ